MFSVEAALPAAFWETPATTHREKHIQLWREASASPKRKLRIQSCVRCSGNFMNAVCQPAENPAEVRPRGRVQSVESSVSSRKKTELFSVQVELPRPPGAQDLLHIPGWHHYCRNTTAGRQRDSLLFSFKNKTSDSVAAQSPSFTELQWMHLEYFKGSVHCRTSSPKLWRRFVWRASESKLRAS